MPAPFLCVARCRPEPPPGIFPGSSLASAEKDLRAAGFTLLSDSTKNPEWLPGLRKSAMKIMRGELTPAEIAKAALAATVAGHQVTYYQRRMQALSNELTKTREQLGKYVRLQPKSRGTDAPGSKPKQASSIEELVGQTMPTD
jgi:hypothetical protein